MEDVYAVLRLWLLCKVLRSRAAHEILDTERKYCSCLWTLIHHFSLSLRQSDIISAQEVEYVSVFFIQMARKLNVVTITILSLFCCWLINAKEVILMASKTKNKHITS